MSKPTVLILGATGFIGRVLTSYLVKGDLAVVTTVDKTLPNCAYLSKEEEAMFDKTTFLQKNLLQPTAIAEIWANGNFDYVINLAAETKYGHNDEVYAERVEHLSLACAKEAAKHNPKKYIEVSTAQVYEPTEKPKKEDGKTDPWTGVAKRKLNVESQLKQIAGLNLVIVRPANVYGPGDRLSIAPRIIAGAVYKHTNETMKFLWTKDLKLNTVHVRDVARALWFLCTANTKSGAIYNLADKNDTDQGKINEVLEKMFGIKTKFAGKVMSNMASTLAMDKIVAEVNEKHVAPWSQMTKDKGIAITPLSPYLDQELLYKKHLSVDGTAIEGLGFKYEVPNMTEQNLREWVKYYTDLKLFPDGYLQ
eukprot:TRINITY_DN22525_c0_g1_i1.p1 TRINITY_DN22525_c0_g1~~TRINITY_DN22525_c0_g1_i1.p1  ORF type:complete len:364 (-),score=92.26 TRINITY_DN22525_c0_g1_i1:71-1162(-)